MSLLAPVATERFKKMTTFEKRIQVSFSQRQMYELVADVAAYPEFLPWCSQVEILNQQDDSQLVRIGLRYQQLPQLSLTTRATFHPHTSLHLRLVSGSFLAAFSGDWFFAPCSEGAGCIVTFRVTYRFSGRLLKLALSPFFSLMVSMLPDRFIQRAEKIYSSAQA